VEIHIKGLKLCKRTKHKYHSTQAQRKEAQSLGKSGPEHKENKAKTQHKLSQLCMKPPLAWPSPSRCPPEQGDQRSKCQQGIPSRGVPPYSTPGVATC
jgi:hypothetical protein